MKNLHIIFFLIMSTVTLHASENPTYDSEIKQLEEIISAQLKISKKRGKDPLFEAALESHEKTKEEHTRKKKKA